MKNYQRFLLTLAIGFTALVAQFVFHSATIAFYIIAITGGIIAIQMFIGMIETLRSGKYGVDILAITAIVATLAVGQYWASLVVLIMLTGGDSLEDYASRQAKNYRLCLAIPHNWRMLFEEQKLRIASLKMFRFMISCW